MGLAQFGADLPTQQREYQKFVDAGVGITRAPWKDAVGQILIGSAPWVEQQPTGGPTLIQTLIH